MSDSLVDHLRMEADTFCVGGDEDTSELLAKAAAHIQSLEAQLAAVRAQPVPLTDAQIEAGREAIFSTGNPFCPCDRKTMQKAVRWAERKHGITDAALIQPPKEAP